MWLVNRALEVGSICEHPHALAWVIAILVVSFVTLRTQDYIVTHQLRSRDLGLFDQVKGRGYDVDVTGLYGWMIALRVLRALRSREDLTRHFRVVYRVYVATAVITAILMVILVAVAFIHDDVCK